MLNVKNHISALGVCLLLYSGISRVVVFSIVLQVGILFLDDCISEKVSGGVGDLLQHGSAQWINGLRGLLPTSCGTVGCSSHPLGLCSFSCGVNAEDGGQEVEAREEDEPGYRAYKACDTKIDIDSLCSCQPKAQRILRQEQYLESTQQLRVKRK
jgi:hypothetical protein